MADFSHIDSTSVAGAVAMLISESPDMVALVENRILDFDPRPMGWDITPANVSLFTSTNRLKLTIVVDDNGGAPPFIGPREAVSREVYIWVMGQATMTMARQVPKTLDALRKYLHHKQIMGGPMLQYRFTTGPFPTDDGWIGRHTYSINGVFA